MFHARMWLVETGWLSCLCYISCQDVISFDKLVEYGVVSEKDRQQLFYTDDEYEAFNYLKNFLLQDKLVLGSHYVHKSLRAGGGASASRFDRTITCKSIRDEHG